MIFNDCEEKDSVTLLREKFVKKTDKNKAF